MHNEIMEQTELMYNGSEQHDGWIRYCHIFSLTQTRECQDSLGNTFLKAAKPSSSCFARPLALASFNSGIRVQVEEV